MEPIGTIALADHDVPEGTRAFVIAKDQPPYRALPALVTPDGQVLSQWVLTDDERLRIAAGEPLTLVQHTFGGALQPIRLGVGRMSL